MNVDIENSEYLSPNMENVPGLAHDNKTFSGWHINVLFQGDLEQDPPFRFMVFDPDRIAYTGDVLRGKNHGEYSLRTGEKSPELTDGDVLGRILALALEFEVVLEGLGQGVI